MELRTRTFSGEGVNLVDANFVIFENMNWRNVVVFFNVGSKNPTP